MKNKLKLTIIEISALVLMVAGATYAFFVVGNSNADSNEVRVETYGVIVALEDVDPIPEENIISPNNLTITRYLR